MSHAARVPTQREAVLSVLRRERPSRFVYAPNYWQWFAHHRNHRSLPAEVAHCRTQLELIHHLGLDVFSRNVYCDEQQRWFGGLAEETWNGVEVREQTTFEGKDRIIERTYLTRRGTLQERFRYVSGESTLVHEEFALSDPERQLDALEELISARQWRFHLDRYRAEQGRVGNGGVVVAGELFSPLKALHLLAGPVNTTYLIADHGDRLRGLLCRHEEAQLGLVRQMAEAGVPAMMAMDNLDVMFHPPAYVERFSASFYERASRICRDHGSTFWIHACGKQKANLNLIDSLGVDGLEGVAFPPLGDVTLEEALQMTSKRFLITGGISAFQTRDLKTRGQVDDYLGGLFEKLWPFAHRFMLAASCNTAIDASWDALVNFRDAWRELGLLTRQGLRPAGQGNT